MNKQKVDQIITDYLQKLYGFAVRRTFSYEEAEELCSEIMLEVYQSLLSADEIVNLEGYIWRISENTYSRYVSSIKEHQGVSIDGIEIPYYDENNLEDDERIRILRREIAFLSEIRRKIVFLFYYKKHSIAYISTELHLPEGTVKWHLNKARKELKEGYSMERRIGKLGLSPVEAIGFSHGGSVGLKGGPEYYLGDKVRLNIVYSVYHSPKTKQEIAQELGLTPVYIEDMISILEDNGYLVKTKNNKYTTYVVFNPEQYSLEQEENVIRTQLKIAEDLVKEYVLLVREAIKNIKNVYIPTANRELFEAAVIFYSILNRCRLDFDHNLPQYIIKDTNGGRYYAYVDIASQRCDPDYESQFKDLPCYWACGDMTRRSEKYPVLCSWSVNSKYSTREGGWKNNLTADYEYLYELIKGDISDTPVNEEKINRLRELNFISEDNSVNVMIFEGDKSELFDKIPPLDQSVKDRYAKQALDNAMQVAKSYPPQMQDFIVNFELGDFIGQRVALMVMDILYSDGTFKPLDERERITSNLIMFSDILP